MSKENLRKLAHQCGDGTRGPICELRMDDRDILSLGVKTRHRFFGKEVQIPMKQVDGAKPSNQQIQNEKQYTY